MALYWNGNDDLSGIEHYEYALGTASGGTDLLDWTAAGTDLSVDIPGLTLTEGDSYFGSVRAFDAAGNMTELNGNGVIVDITPPYTGAAIDITVLDNTTDQAYTGSANALQASWAGFTDNLSGLNSYDYAVGSESLLTDIKGWTSVSLDTLMVDNSFTLENGAIYYVSIRSTDDVGNVSVPISTDGITADHEGPFGFAATDGDSSDIDRQNYTDLYQGHWSMFEDLLSGLAFYETGLYDSTAGSYTLSWDSSGIDTLIEFTGLSLVQDHEYALHIRAVDHVLNTGPVISSDGVLIDQTAPDPPQNLVGFFSSERIYLTWDGNIEQDLSEYIVYGGSDTLSPITVVSTTATEAEAYAAGFGEDQQIFLHITAKDVPGNESPISNRVSGIPRTATITRIVPDTSLMIAKDDNQLSIHFSQPLSDIGTVSTSSLAYSSMNISSSYTAEDTSIVISVNDPWASLDTVTFSLNTILDWAGTEANEKRVTFTTYLLGDYNSDYAVDVTDLSSFVSAWNSDDFSYELGPVTGTVPHLIPARNELFDLRDMMAFTRMWHYSHGTDQSLMLAYDPIGDDAEIEQDGSRLSLALHPETNAAHLKLIYPRASKSVMIPPDIESDEMIQLTHHESETGTLVIEKAFIRRDGAKLIYFDINSLDRNDVMVDISYIAYDDSNRVIMSGRKMVNVVAVPFEYALHQNYPNPFNPVTRINFDLPEARHVQLFIYDILGREVTSLVNEVQEPGYRTITWHCTDAFGRNVGAGMYFYSIQAGDFRQVRKMVLLK